MRSVATNIDYDIASDIILDAEHVTVAIGPYYMSTDVGDALDAIETARTNRHQIDLIDYGDGSILIRVHMR